MHSVSIIIPAYNEAKRLPSSLEAIYAYLRVKQFSFSEVVVVDDGSTDNTAERAASFPGVRVLRNPGNRGKGYSVRHGMMEGRGEWLLFSDADLSAPIDELDKLSAATARENALVAIGSRALDRSLVGVHQPAAREWAGRLFNLGMRAMTGLPFHDTQCGFKLYHRSAAHEIFPRQQLDGFGFDVEDLFIAHVLGIRTVEVPVRWNNVEGTTVSLGKGLDSFVDLLRVRRFHLEGKYRQATASR